MQDDTSALNFPTLEVEGVKYVSKWSAGAMIRLEREGVDLNRFAPQLDEDGVLKQTKWPLELVFQMLAACISSGDRKFTGEELADLIPANQTQQTIAVLTATISKVSPQANGKKNGRRK